MKPPTDTATRDPSDSQASDNQTPTEVMHDLTSRLAELKEYFAYYLSAKADLIRVSIRKMGTFAVLGAVGLIAAGALVATAVVLLCVGLAGALSALFGYPWLGNIVLGLLVLVIVGIGVQLGMKMLFKQWHHQTVEKYESRQSEQRSEYGRDVREQSAVDARRQ